jgi:hypothetical protein
MDPTRSDRKRTRELNACENSGATREGDATVCGSGTDLQPLWSLNSAGSSDDCEAERKLQTSVPLRTRRLRELAGTGPDGGVGEWRGACQC